MANIKSLHHSNLTFKSIKWNLLSFKIEKRVSFIFRKYLIKNTRIHKKLFLSKEMINLLVQQNQEPHIIAYH